MTGATTPRSSPRVIVPLYLKPGFATGSTTMSPVRGLHVQPLTAAQSKTGRDRLWLPFYPNCIISVDADEYEEGARERLEAAGHYRSQKLPLLQLDDGPMDPGTFVSGASMAKWILTSLVLTKPFAFVFGPVHRFRGFHGAETDVERIEQVSGRDRELIGVQRYRFEGMPQPDLNQPFDPREFGHLVVKLESYFRPRSFRVDRLAVALTSLWSSLCTEFADQAYVSLSVIVESLLSTQESEITHQLAERIACLLASQNTKAIDVYQRVKRLYGTRSSIVHGRGMSARDKAKLSKLAKKQAIAVPEDYPLHMHPLSTSVPLADLRDLTDIGIKLIRTFVFDEELLQLVQGHDDEGLDNFFLELLLGYESDCAADQKPEASAPSTPGSVEAASAPAADAPDNDSERS